MVGRVGERFCQEGAVAGCQVTGWIRYPEAAVGGLSRGSDRHVTVYHHWTMGPTVEDGERTGAMIPRERLTTF